MHWTVAGAGNILCADDGFGVRVVQALAQERLPAHVELLEMGVDPMALRPSLERKDKLVIVDALAAGGKAGDLYVTRLSDIEPIGKMSSLHDFSYWHMLDEFPWTQGWVVGVEPETLACFYLSLSPPVAAQIIPATKTVLRLITEIGVIATDWPPNTKG